MLQKRYQALLIKHLKEQIDRNIHSENPDQTLMVFSDPAIANSFFDKLKKEYQNGFYVHITEEQTDLELTATYIGRYASRVKTAYKTITDKLLGMASGVKTAKNWRERQANFLGKDPLLCNICQTVMVFVDTHIPNPLTLVKVTLQSAFS